MRAYKLSELTDSGIIYTRRLPRFAFFIVALTLLAVAGALVWAHFAIKPSVVTGAGAVQGANRTPLMSGVSGVVTEVMAPNSSEVTSGEEMLRLDSPEIRIEEEGLTAQREALQADLDLQERFTTALKEGWNPFDKANPAEAGYFYRFTSIQNKKSKLRVDRASMAAIGYSEVEIDNAVTSNKLEEREIDNAALAESSEQANTFRSQIEEMDLRLSAARSSAEAYRVVAAATGTVHLNSSVKVGTVINAGEQIGTISSTQDGLSTVILVAVPDRQFISVGDAVNVTVDGLPALQYGKIHGQVTSIDNDITTVGAVSPDGSSGGMTSYFAIHIALDQNFVESADGDRHELTNGTSVTANFIYGEVTYLQYVTEMLGFA
ncbi:HlyD family secretion protein [Microbacterium testaceum]|uniref:HlyD family secretion protein n=1 Tax=Microbacterium testaceum TaxID=2033 RepID=UPI002AC6F5B9|nr:HlyD family efflux transporter periplasmic adaptor subunit [Microbacterium testaceum]MDZ5145942.1 HlyD family efflux transporter periplasmic adaptor subunit [Microbacterium testaceum]